MEEQFLDRELKCTDCSAAFIFTAGEQLFFFDKQFKNDPKRCKACKSRRSGLAAVANGQSIPKSAMLRTETRTQCSDCGIETTVPFKPTQGRPVLCRQCFGKKAPSPSIPPAGLMEPSAMLLAELSIEASGAMLSHDAAMSAAASVAGAHGGESSVATEADLACVAEIELLAMAPGVNKDEFARTQELVAQTPAECMHAPESLVPERLMALAAEPSEA